MKKIGRETAFGPTPERFTRRLASTLAKEEEPVKRKSIASIPIAAALVLILAVGAFATLQGAVRRDEVYSYQPATASDYDYVPALYQPLTKAIASGEREAQPKLSLLAKCFAALPEELSDARYDAARERSAWNLTAALLLVEAADVTTDRMISTGDSTAQVAAALGVSIDRLLETGADIDAIYADTLSQARDMAGAHALSSGGATAGTHADVAAAALSSILAETAIDAGLLGQVRDALNAGGESEPYEVRLLRALYALTEHAQRDALDAIFAVAKLHQCAYDFGGAESDTVLLGWAVELDIATFSVRESSYVGDVVYLDIAITPKVKGISFMMEAAIGDTQAENEAAAFGAEVWGVDCDDNLIAASMRDQSITREGAGVILHRTIFLGSDQPDTLDITLTCYAYPPGTSMATPEEARTARFPVTVTRDNTNTASLQTDIETSMLRITDIDVSLAPQGMTTAIIGLPADTRTPIIFTLLGAEGTPRDCSSGTSYYDEETGLYHMDNVWPAPDKMPETLRLWLYTIHGVESDDTIADVNLKTGEAKVYPAAFDIPAWKVYPTE